MVTKGNIGIEKKKSVIVTRKEKSVKNFCFKKFSFTHMHNKCL